MAAQREVVEVILSIAFRADPSQVTQRFELRIESRNGKNSLGRGQFTFRSHLVGLLDHLDCQQVGTKVRTFGSGCSWHYYRSYTFCLWPDCGMAIYVHLR